MPNNKPKHNEEEPVEFKVVDRRMFTSDGEPRPGAEPEPVVETLVEPVVEPLATLQPAQSAPAPEPAKPKVDVPPPAQPFSAVAPPSAGQSMAAPPSLSDAPPAAATPSPGAPSAAPGGPVQFEHLIMSLVTQAM